MAKNALERIVQEAKEEALSTSQTGLEEQNSTAWVRQMSERIGAAKATDAISKMLDAATIRQLEEFQQQKGYLAYECPTFDKFLNEYRPNGLDKNAYYRRKELLTAEGDQVFNRLNELHVPASARKLITAGSIEIEGDIIKIGDKSAPVTDAKQVKLLFREAADAFENQAEQASKEQNKYRKMMKRAGFKFETDDAGKEKIIAPDTDQVIVVFDKHAEGDPANHAYLKVCASLAELQRELKQLPSTEAEQRLAQYRVGIQSAFESVLFFAAADSPTRKPDNVGANALADELSDDELAELAEE